MSKLEAVIPIRLAIAIQFGCAILWRLPELAWPFRRTQWLSSAQVGALGRAWRPCYLERAECTRLI
jgi:hypothetical protein